MSSVVVIFLAGVDHWREAVLSGRDERHEEDMVHEIYTRHTVIIRSCVVGDSQAKV